MPESIESPVSAVVPATGEDTAPSAHSLPPGARIEALYAPRGSDGGALPPVEELLRALQREIALTPDAHESAELRVRAALLAWDGRGQAETALQLLGDLQHPVATALRLHAAIDAEGNAALLRFADEVQQRGDAEELAEVSELLLWRGEYARAATLLEATAPSAESGERGQPLRALRALTLILAGRGAEAAEALSRSADPQALLLAAQLCEDTLGDAERARTLLRRVLEKPRALAARDHARVLERLLDLESRRPIETGRTEILRRKLEVLGGVRGLVSALEDPDPTHVEIFLTALLLAKSLERSAAAPALAESVSLLTAVTRYCQEQRDGAAHLALHMALRARAGIDVMRQAFAEAAQGYEELALRSEALATQPGAQPEHAVGETVRAPQLWAWAQAYGRRAAELWEARVGDEAGRAQAQVRARSAYERLFAQDPADGVLALALARLLLKQGAVSDAALVMDRHAQAVGEAAPAELVRAARAAEAVRDSRVAERWLDALPGERLALEALVRLHRRRGDRPRLCHSYRRLWLLSQSPAYRAVAGALALEALPAREAEALLAGEEAGEGAAEDAPQDKNDILVPLARVLLLQRLGRHPELAAAVQAVLPRLRDAQTQAGLLLVLARTAAEHLGDAELARSSYQRVLALRPGDIVALHALARFTAEGAVEDAVALLRQAVTQALATPADGQGEQAAAVLLCELGALYERLGERPGAQHSEAEAIASYEEAARLDPRCRPALRALCVLHKAARRPAEVLEALTRLLPLCRDEQERLPALLRSGSCAEVLAASDAHMAERALWAYTEVLHVEATGPAAGVALERLERLCRRLGRWDTLRTVLEPLPHTPRVLRALCEAGEQLERYPDVARYREEELAQLNEPAEVLRAAQALAELYEVRLQQPEAAARIWERAYHADPGESLAVAAVPAALERLYSAQGRHRELAALLARELERVEAQETHGADTFDGKDELRERRRGLLLRQAGLCLAHLGEPATAVALYERVLSEWPKDATALSALAGLYSAQERPDALRRVLEQRGRSASDPQERAKILLQLGELLERGGAEELPQAQAAYQEAFYQDPANRLAFTALERVCYRREEWDEVLRMYDAALRLVEQQRSRAYRLGDLYARRGQVLLQYLARPADAAASYLKALEFDADNDANQAALERIYAQAAAERAAQAAGQDRPAAPERITLMQPVVTATASGEGAAPAPTAQTASTSGPISEWASLIAAYERRAALVRDDGKRVEILRRAARVAAAKLRDIPEAIRLYQKLHAVDPTDGEALDALERHYERAREHEKLIALLGTRLALATTEPESIALNLRMAALCEEGLHDHGRAIDAYRQVLELSPNHREALEAMGRLFEATERWAELVEATRRQIRLTSDRTQKALLYFKCGSVMEAKFAKEDDAIRYYEAAVKTSPSCLPAVHGLRDIYLRRRDWPKVTQTLELEAKLWTEDKERAGIYAHIGQIYLDELHDMDRAIQYYESALSVDRECLPANRALFEIYYERGDWARSVPISQVLSAKVNREGDPAERSAFYGKRAIVAEHTGDLRTAAESLVVALEIQPENMDALERLVALCRRDASVYDFAGTLRELEKLYRRRSGVSTAGQRQSSSAQSVAMLDPGGAQRGQEPALMGLSQTLVARSILAERSYAIETAEELLDEAVRLSPLDYPVTEALVSLNERLRRFAPARDVLLAYSGRLDVLPRTDKVLVLRTRARLRLAEMYSEAAMEPEQAVAVLRALSEELQAAGSAAPQDLYRLTRFRLAQEQYLLGRYPEARATIESLIEAAASPAQAGSAGSVAAPPELARYYDYLGRIQEASGDGATAQRYYRRAVDLDQGFALPVLALARRAVSGGDRGQAEQLIREALAQAARKGDPRAELLLLRGVARLLAPVDVAGAAAAYRRAIQQATGQLDAESRQAAMLVPAATGEATANANDGTVVARETLDDRVALADLLLQAGETTGLAAARAELHLVLQRDLRHAPAYRLLADAYERLGERERAGRVLAALGLLGYGEAGGVVVPPGSAYRPAPRRGTISDELRLSKLVQPALTSPYMELLAAIGESLAQAYPAPWPPALWVAPAVDSKEAAPTALVGDAGVPASRVADAAFKLALSEAQRLHACPDVELLVAHKVPGAVLALESFAGRPTIVMESSLLDRSDAERRFLLGRAMEPLRGGYAVLLRLRPAEVLEVERLLHNLLRPESERDAATQDFVRTLPRKAYRVVERLTGTTPKLSVAAFFAALPQCADRAGLLTCDDIAAATRMMARLQGEELALVDSIAGGAVLLGQVQGGAELVRYFLSDSYHEVRGSLRDASHL